jgi:hypothetical protein
VELLRQGSPYIVVGLRAAQVPLLFRGFCPIDPIWRLLATTLASRLGIHGRFLLLAGGGTEISVCATGGNRRAEAS